MPSGFNQQSSDIETIVGIQFSVFSPEEITRRSVVEITSAATYDGSEPRIGGLFDPRMGVLENGKSCRSCGQTNHGCPGHFGHYQLTRPVYYIQFFEEVQKILRCVCIRCSKLLIDKNLNKDILRKRGEARWKDVKKRCLAITRCGQQSEDGCGAVQPKGYNTEGVARIVANFSEMAGVPSTTQPLEVEYVLQILRRICDEDVDFIGFSRHWCRPDWMVCTVLPIPPPQVRPSVVQDNNQRSEDDLTHKLFDIIKYDKMLAAKIEAGAAKNVIDDLASVVQFHVATLVDNNIPGMAVSIQRSGRPLKSLKQRLGSKEGRIRSNIQGKRVEFSARSVITPDPNISIGELGVPLKIAMNLTVPDRVTQFNRDKLYKFVQNGADNYPGAKTVVKADGRMISLRHINTREIVLNAGDVVHRHMMDGDIVLFNRQPTLHRMSMMGHRAKVLPYNTFRLNVSVCSAYNADFDGDEMNLHLPQSYEASVELQEIAAVPHQLITPRDARPIIGIVQDTLVGTYRITRPGGGSFNLREYMNLMMYNKRFDGTIPAPREGTAAAPKWTGHQIVSTLLPPLNLSMENGAHGDNPGPENKVIIQEGNVIQGTFDKGIFSKASKGIIHTTYNDYGPTDTVELIDAFQNTIESYLILNGFSVGISDLIADEDTKVQMEEVIQGRKKEVEEILLQVHLDLFDNNTGKTNQEELENKVFGTLNKATDDSGKIGQASLASENRMIAMVKAGSKGGPTNIAQMMACVGQQNIEGKRIPYGYLERTLPHYKKYDDGAEARGFIESSFIRGLTPQEFFFHAMSGREGLIDTACKTAETGYIQRKLIKAMEDLVIQHDGTVRDANMNIVQFTYGEDGTNATKLESLPLPLGKLTEADVETTYGLTDIDFTAIFTEGVDRGADVDPLKEFVAAVKEDRRMVVEGIFASGRQGNVNSPVNLERMINNLRIRFGFTAESKTDLTPAYLLDGIKRILAKTQPKHTLWGAILRFYLAPHSLIVAQRFTKAAFETLAEMIVVKNWQSWAHPGELVGILAAQSIGEPSTQMTLNSVDGEEKIIITRDGEILTPKIGEFIDNYYATVRDQPEKVQHLPNSQIYIPLDDGHDWKALSPDENGKMVWTKLEAITRHPVINADGTSTILDVELESGRRVRATKALSFLTEKDGKLVHTLGSDLKVGMKLPLALTLGIEQLGEKKELSLRSILPPTEWLYGADVQLALTHMTSENAKGNRHWFSKANGSLFTVPYTRSDGFRDAFENGRNTNEMRVGCVYPKRTRPDVSHIPETILLDREFGFFAGAYLAEGMSNSTQVNITNNDVVYLERVKTLMDAWNVGTHMVCEDRHCKKTNIKGRTSSLVIHSTLLAKVMGELFGKKSYTKTMPAWVLQAPHEFVTGLVDGYFSGDGTVEKKSLIIKASSASEDLIVRMQTLLARYGIFSKMTSYMPHQGQFKSVSRHYNMTIGTHYAAIFAKCFTLSLMAKQERINVHTAHRASSKMRATATDMCGECAMDAIKSITECLPTNGWVYDVTVEGTRNFTTISTVAMADTFHLAGVASKSNVTRGVPRLNELLKVTKEPKATALTAYLKPEYRESKEKAREVAQDLALTVMREITKKIGIYYDPNDDMTVVDEDRDLMEFYRIFENAQIADKMEQKHSNFMLRIELDRDAMFNKSITMNDVAFVLRNKYPTLHVVYSDYNSNRLVMRIRVTLTAPEMDDLENFKKLQNTLLNSVVIRGVPGIKAVNFRKDVEKIEQVDGEYKQVTQYVLDTDGSNFLEVMNHPAVDGDRIYSTNVHDIYNQLGVEAARVVLLTEITVLFEEAGLNFRHLGLLCDVMTCSGRLISTDRYGINKTDAGPIGKASFEQTSTILQNAAIFGEVDPITSVSANIMTGQTIRGGTAFSQILLDEQALPRLLEGLPALEGIEEEGETEGDVEQMLEEDANDACGRARFQMNMAIPARSTEIDEEDEVELQII